MKRAEKRAFNRQLIISTTDQLIRQQGISQTSIRQIREQSGLSIMTIYKYFTDKTDLINQTIIAMLNEQFDQADQIILSQEMSFAERIQKIPGPDKFIQTVPDGIGQEIIDAVKQTPILDEILQNRISQFFQIIIVEGRKSNFIQTSASDQAIIDLLSMISFRDRHKSREPNPKRAMEIGHILLYGLTNPGLNE